MPSDETEELAPEHMKNELQTLRNSVKSMQQVIQHLTMQQRQQQQVAPPARTASPAPPVAAAPAPRPPPAPRTPPMTTEEKHQLSQLIQSDKLGNEHLATIVGIIREKLPAITDVWFLPTYSLSLPLSLSLSLSLSRSLSPSSCDDTHAPVHV